LESSLREGEKDRLGKLNFRTIPAAGESKFVEEDAQIILSNRKKNEPQHDHTFPAEPANC
jgi:hypothetical protein